MKNEVLKELIKLDKKANREGYKKKYDAYLPLHLYVLDGNIHEIKKYIEAGYNINIKDCWGRTALYYAIFNKNINILKLLVNAGGDYHYRESFRGLDNCSLLHLAAAEGYLDKVRYLVEELHLDINEVTREERTPFWYSLLFDNLNVARYFVGEHAQLFPNCENMTALLWLFIDTIKKQKESIKELENKMDNGFIKLSKMLKTRKL